MCLLFPREWPLLSLQFFNPHEQSSDRNCLTQGKVPAQQWLGKRAMFAQPLIAYYLMNLLSMEVLVSLTM